MQAFLALEGYFENGWVGCRQNAKKANYLKSPQQGPKLDIALPTTAFGILTVYQTIPVIINFIGTVFGSTFSAKRTIGVLTIHKSVPIIIYGVTANFHWDFLIVYICAGMYPEET
jgi:hypothetical protein